MITETIKISGMNCNHCIKSVNEAFKKLPVEKYEVKMGSVDVEYDTEKITRKQIADAVYDSGYDVIEE